MQDTAIVTKEGKQTLADPHGFAAFSFSAAWWIGAGHGKPPWSSIRRSANRLYLIPDAAHPNTTLDPALLSGLHFSVGSAPGMPLDYRFCIRDLAFLDASSNEILP